MHLKVDQHITCAVKLKFLNVRQLCAPHTMHSLYDLEQFIHVTSSGLGVTVEEGDYDGLVGVMGHLMAVKERQPRLVLCTLNCCL